MLLSEKAIYSCNLAWSTGNKYCKALRKILADVLIDPGRIALDIFGGAKSSSTLMAVSSFVAYLEGIVKSNTVDYAILCQNPVCKQRKHTTGGTVQYNILLMVLYCIDVRNCLCAGEVLPKGTDFAANATVDTGLGINFGVNKACFIRSHSDG